jgi:uncharacterized membrane protein YhaH (DUF805 family)
MHEFKKVMFENYFNIKGRASRREYWMYMLIVCIVCLIISIIAAIIFTRDSTAYTTINLMVNLVFLLPSICVLIRRLHDTGKRGIWAFLLLVPLVGPIVILVFALKKSQKGNNEFGPSPLELKSHAG